MLSPEEYRAFEREQSNRAFQNERVADRFDNYERWQVTRYNNNLRRYFVTARQELGTQFKHYVDLGNWQGGRELENKMFEELQYHYRNKSALRVTRSMVNDNCKLFEVTEYGKPLLMVMILNGETIYSSKPYPLKDGYRYRLQTQ
tara:strand:- start:47 stop:481 length:435 start_codon:yes stop_codon:yes gene_type:complete